MKVLIADKFEQHGLDALRALGLDVIYQPDRLQRIQPALLELVGDQYLHCGPVDQGREARRQALV